MNIIPSELMQPAQHPPRSRERMVAIMWYNVEMALRETKSYGSTAKALAKAIDGAEGCINDAMCDEYRDQPELIREACSLMISNLIRKVLES